MEKSEIREVQVYRIDGQLVVASTLISAITNYRVWMNQEKVFIKNIKREENEYPARGANAIIGLELAGYDTEERVRLLEEIEALNASLAEEKEKLKITSENFFNAQEQIKKLSEVDRKPEDNVTGSFVPEFIDLGLPSGRLWADRNVGARRPAGHGLYFSFGNVEGHTDSDGFDFGYGNDEGYANTPGAKLEGDIPEDEKYDVARDWHGSHARMPKKEDFEELVENCDQEFTTVDNVAGMKFTSRKNGNSIFFPASGYRDGTSLDDRGSSGDYWSASLYSQAGGYVLYFSASVVNPADCSHRFSGFSVRAVQ